MIVMYEFLADIDLPVPFTEEFLNLVPRQRAQVNKLMHEGVISSYALSIESGKLWINLIAESEEKVSELLNSFPIAPFISYTVHKLTFHNSINLKIPDFSLN
ncbi:MAG: hypothetical protein IAE93_07890 [Ignavibacteria bacterium]|nr:hypothetical protein [Ignavibacteria bacterium]